MRIVFHHRAVHVGARVALVAVGDDVLRLALSCGEEGPLGSGGIAGAATTAESGLADDLDDLFGRHASDDPLERLVAAVADVGLDAVRIDDPAVLEHDAFLAREERDPVVEDVRLDGLVILDVGADDVDADLGVDGLIHRLFDATAQNADQRSTAAEAHAAGRDEACLESEILTLDRLLHGLERCTGAGRQAGGAHAGLHAPWEAVSLRKLPLADFVKIDWGGHQASPPVASAAPTTSSADSGV